jgi:hypothetical protein
VWGCPTCSIATSALGLTYQLSQPQTVWVPDAVSSLICTSLPYSTCGLLCADSNVAWFFLVAASGHQLALVVALSPKPPAGARLCFQTGTVTADTCSAAQLLPCNQPSPPVPAQQRGAEAADMWFTESLLAFSGESIKAFASTILGAAAQAPSSGSGVQGAHSRSCLSPDGPRVLALGVQQHQEPALARSVQQLASAPMQSGMGTLYRRGLNASQELAKALSSEANHTKGASRQVVVSARSIVHNLL